MQNEVQETNIIRKKKIKNNINNVNKKKKI